MRSFLIFALFVGSLLGISEYNSIQKEKEKKVRSKLFEEKFGSNTMKFIDSTDLSNAILHFSESEEDLIFYSVSNLTVDIQDHWDKSKKHLLNSNRFYGIDLIRTKDGKIGYRFEDFMHNTIYTASCGKDLREDIKDLTENRRVYGQYTPSLFIYGSVEHDGSYFVADYSNYYKINISCDNIFISDENYLQKKLNQKNGVSRYSWGDTTK